MNSEQFDYFELAYAEKSFAAAAKRVPISPQGLSKSIKSLEKELDITLFVRDPKTGELVPTAAAHEVHDFAAIYQSNVRLLHEAIDQLRGNERHEIRLGCSFGVLGSFGPELLKDFQTVYSNIEVAFWESDDRQCEKDLLAGNYDMAIIVGHRIPEGCGGTEIYRSLMYMWMKRDDPLASSTTTGELTIEDLAGRDIAIPGRSYACYKYLNEQAALHHVQLGTVFEMNEIFRVYNYTMRSNALGFANGTLIDTPVSQLNDMIIALPLKNMYWGFYLVHEQHHILDEPEQLLWNWCTEAAKLLPHNELA